jgi:hypothetical protein
MENSRLEELTEQSIEASNRTTYAVRAFVRFTLIEITAAISGVGVGVLFALGSGAIEVGIAVGSLVIVVGGVYGLAVGWNELKKSDNKNEGVVIQEGDPPVNCPFCGARLHMFTTKCPKCKRQVGL